MLVTDLLSELRSSILRDTSALTAGAADLLWTDAQLARYINEAHMRFARRTQILRDNTTPAVTQIALVAGQTEYPLHPSVISVLSTRYAADLVDLPRAGHVVLDTRAPLDTPWFDLNNVTVMSPGRPRTFSTDQAFRTLRVYPTPTAAEAGTLVYLRVTRLPLTAITTLGLYASPEIPEEYQIDMLEWAAYKALSNHDADAGNIMENQLETPAEKHRKNFEAAVQEAIQDMKRNTFSPMRWDFTNTPGVTYTRL